LMSPPGERAALARNIVRLATDAELRTALAEQGSAFVRQFTWQRAAERLEVVLARGQRAVAQ